MTMMFGLEKEYFIKKDNNIIELPKNSRLPYDECGFLVEARGLPSEDITLAVFNLLAEEFKLNKLAKKENVDLYAIPLAVIPKDVKLRIRRRFSKGTTKYQNIYGFEEHKNPANTGTAGIHLSVTSRDYYLNKEGVKIYYNTMWDFVSFFRYLDSIFKEDIKLAKRNPGFYELKSDGRIEYRSLPTDIDPAKLIQVVTDYIF